MHDSKKQQKTTPKHQKKTPTTKQLFCHPIPTRGPPKGRGVPVTLPKIHTKGRTWHEAHEAAGGTPHPPPPPPPRVPAQESPMEAGGRAAARPRGYHTPSPPGTHTSRPRSRLAHSITDPRPAPQPRLHPAPHASGSGSTPAPRHPGPPAGAHGPVPSPGRPSRPQLVAEPIRPNSPTEAAGRGAGAPPPHPRPRPRTPIPGRGREGSAGAAHLARRLLPGS